MKPIWAIQKFAVNDADSKGMIESFNSLGIEYRVLEIPPFCYDNIQPVDYDGPVIPYGGTKFIDAIKDDKGWFCVFNDHFTRTGQESPHALACGEYVRFCWMVC